jgi:hypothetical protein
VGEGGDSDPSFSILRRVRELGALVDAIGPIAPGSGASYRLLRSRLSRSAVVAGVVCSDLPDVDVLGFDLGIPYKRLRVLSG